MSFVRNILHKMSGAPEVKQDLEVEDEEFYNSEETDSTDTGLETSLHSDHELPEGDADCSAISNFFGYCFFRRRSKKSSPDVGVPAKGSPKGSKEKLAKLDNYDSSQGLAQQMGKNNLPEMLESAPGIRNEDVTVTESRLRENGANVCGDPEGRGRPANPATVHQHNHLNNEEMDRNQSSPSHPKHLPSPISYAGIVRSEQESNKSRAIKPCGHGTVAIAPRIPTQVNNKRELGICSPPSSPEAAGKPKYKRVNSTDSSVSAEASNPSEAPRSNGISSSSSSDTRNQKVYNCDQRQHHPDEEKKNLINQEAKFQSQLNDLNKQLSLRDAEVNKLRFQLEELQRDVFAKSAGVDRLQTELQAAHKESECLRMKVRHVEEDLQNYRQKYNSLNEDLTNKVEDFNSYQTKTNDKIAEMANTIRGLKCKIESLEYQIESLEKEKENMDKERTSLIQQKEQQRREFDESFQKALAEKAALKLKWEEEFEKMRTVEIIKEQELLNDFEWKLREIQQTCKKKLDDKDRKIEEQLKEAYKDAQQKIAEAEKIMTEVKNLKSYEAEVRHLRSLTIEQQTQLQSMVKQHDDMKNSEKMLQDEAKRLRTLVEMEKENLQHMQRVHNHEACETEKKMKRMLDEQKNAVAFYWEERLMQECARLKRELTQLHQEDRKTALEQLESEKNEEIDELKENWEKKLYDSLAEVNSLKSELKSNEEYYHKEVERVQTNTDRDIMELRRIMDKIDMSHHERFEKLVTEHEIELEKINEEQEKRVHDVENKWQHQVLTLRNTLELVKDQMEKESQQKMQSMIHQHRAELDTQWANLIHQKSEAIRLMEDEYISRYKTLEEQFYAQQKSHASREIELLKTIDSLKNEVSSKNSVVDDLQNNVDTLEGGIQVLNQEIAYQSESLIKTKTDADRKIRGLQEALLRMQTQISKQQDEMSAQKSQYHKQAQATIDQLQRKCQCLTKLFEEVRSRYERRESRQEDMNIISDLKQVIAEQEKDLACLNEEKRFYQMKLMNLERFLEGREQEDSVSSDRHTTRSASPPDDSIRSNSTLSNQITIPPTIPECDDDDLDDVDDFDQ